MDAIRRKCRIRNQLIKESIAELIGTMTLVFIGDSSIANNTLTPTSAITIPLGYSAGFAISVCATGGVSGGHLNPAVTLSLCLTGRCRWNRLVPFTIAQFIGGFLGAALTHALFFDLFKADSSHAIFESVFSTYPLDRVLPDGTIVNISTGGAFLDQALGTALLLYAIMAITDKRNMEVPKGLIPWAVGLTLLMIIMCTGNNTGTAVNPARDFSPRVYSYIIGYENAFIDGDHFWWIPLVACYVGAVVGAMFYFFTIELHHPSEEDVQDEATAMKKMSDAPSERQESQARYRSRQSEDGRYLAQRGQENRAFEEMEERGRRY